MCRNFVAKNDFNRGGAHRSVKDYHRVSMNQILEDVDFFDVTMEENWDVNEWGTDSCPTKSAEDSVVGLY